MIDHLMTEAHQNRIQELTEQLYTEIEQMARTMKGEHSKVTFTEYELLLMYVFHVAADLQRRAAARVIEDRSKQALEESG